MSDKCYKSTVFNPMGNFLPFDNRMREQACKDTIEKEKNLIGSNYNIDETFPKIFYTMPVTTSYPDTTGFAKFLFPDPARCRDTGYLCMSNADSTINIDRMGIYAGEKNYQEINQNYVPSKDLHISSYGWDGVIRK